MIDVPNLYLDFRRNADENPNKEPLREQMAALRKTLGPRLLPECGEGRDGLEAFVDLAFPHGLPVTCFVSNTSLVEGRADVTIRPKVDGPRLQSALPEGISIAVRGHLSPAGAADPALIIDRLAWVADTPALPFEREVTAVAMTREESPNPQAPRQNSLPGPAFVGSLPPISVETMRRLDEWLAYLDWREKLVKNRLQGLRYVSVEITEEGLARFLAVAESREAFEKARASFRKDDVKAFELGHSRKPWTFEFNESDHGRVVELGSMRGVEEATVPETIRGEDGPGWDSPVARAMLFELSEDMQNSHDRLADSGADDAAERTASWFPAQGFLALCAQGDLALIRRQRSEINNLEKSGKAPFLTYYLFDASRASVPASLGEIDGWLNPNLNESQKEAVRKMVSALDLCLVQGPPGTGKSTVIGEAAYQFVRRGKKVLISSQANLAVDNALEKLVHDPAIRAVRFGKDEKIDQELPFAKENALGTWYSAIARKCRNATISLWQDAEARIVSRRKWLESADIMHGDLKEAAERMRILDRERANLERIRRAEADRIESAGAQQKAADSLERFIAHLDGGKESDYLLPDELLDAFFDGVLAPLESLLVLTEGIDLNPAWKTRRAESAGVRSGLARDFLVRWSAFKSEDVPRLENDSRLLGEYPRGTAHDAASISELGRIARELERVEEAMQADGSLLPCWKELKAREKKLRTTKAGLAPDFYRRVFNKRSERHLPLHGAAAAAAINGVLSRIPGAQHVIEQGLASARVAAQKEFEKLAGGARIDEAALDKIDRGLRLNKAELETAAAREKDLAGQFEELIKERSAAESFPRPHAAGRFSEFRAIVEKALAEDQAWLDGQHGLRNAWEDLLLEWTRDLEDKGRLANDRVHFQDDYFRACNVVGVTCNEKRRTLEDSGHVHFDVSIVDEVSKATPPELLMPMTLARTTILVGDHRQLPPLFRERAGSWEDAVHESEEQEAEGNGGEITAESFERFRKLVTAGMFKEGFEKAPKEIKATLRVQYRMPPQVMDVVNHFYERKLLLPDSESVPPEHDPRRHFHGLALAGADGRPYVEPSWQAVFIDTSFDPEGSMFEEQRPETSTSACNDLEAALIAKTLDDIDAASLRLGFGPAKRKQAGVISFYGLQVRRIREAIRERHRMAGRKDFEAIQVDVNPVDRFQGKERPIILVSVVRNKERARAHSGAHIAQFERINVAFSRAQELLVVFGAKEMLHRYPVRMPNMDCEGWTERHVYRAIIDEILRGGRFLECRKVMSAAEWREWKAAWKRRK